MDQAKYSAIFHSRDEQFKSPAGPVKADTPVEFNILLSPEATIRTFDSSSSTTRITTKPFTP